MVPERAACRLASARRGGLIETSSLLVVVARRLPGDTPVFHRHLHDGAAVELPDRRAVEFLPWCRAFGHRRQAFLLSTRDFLIADQHVAATLCQVDADPVPGPQPRESATRSAFRRTVENRRAV